MDRGKKWLVCLCAVLALVSAGYLVWYYARAQATRAQLQSLTGMKQPAAEPTQADETDENGILLEYRALYEKNSDLVGWLTIDGTEVDYPVVQAADNDYYLHRDFDKAYAFHGLPFLDAACDIQNGAAGYMIYGHNMRDNTMFGSLKNYLQESFYLEHSVLRFDTIYGRGEYEILAVFLSKAYSTTETDVFKYYQYPVFADETVFNSYVAHITAMSLYDTGVRAQWGDTLLTLSTCSRHTENGRLVIVARKLAQDSG